MKKIVLWMLAALCMVSLASCQPVDPGYENTVAYAGWSDDASITEGALNRDLLQNGNGEHLPIFKLDTVGDLDRFKKAYGDVLTMDQGYNQYGSLEERLSQTQWDRESFFAQNTLLVVYVPTNSGSYRFVVGDVSILDGAMRVYVEQKNATEGIVVTDDMAGWFILVGIPDKDARECTSFDAVLVK
ncbi:MAG: hypothetical protein IJY66_07275 [Clostridia bacterium]|nr:hypothetical protein [Clostridia bacterium]